MNIFRNGLIKKLNITQQNVSVRSCSTKLNNLNIQKLEDDQLSEVFDDELGQREEELERKRNKSRLSTAHYKILHEQNPYPEPQLWHHGTLKYIRRTYGRYGEASGIDPSICWPVKHEREELLEYEKVRYPYTIPQMIEAAKAEREEKQKKVMERQQDIINKMLKLEQWKHELNEKINKKETEAMEAKVRRERLIEEVKRHFGYTVDPRDERFKELLAKKEKEQKKMMKEARKKAREEKLSQKSKKKDSGEAVEEDNQSPEQLDIVH